MRRVLLITYYFPPSGGPGVQRALKFAKYLPDFGWQTTALTVRPEQAAYPDLDPSLAEDVPPSTRVERTNAWDPYALYARLLGKQKQDTVSVGFLGEAEPGWKERLARWVRANVFLPDARVGWVPFAIRRGRKLLRATPHDAIFTTGPPHSAHLAGLMLSRRTGLPWVADFRDPWAEIDFAGALPSTALARRVDAALERAVLKAASAVTVVTPSWRDMLRRRVRGRCIVLRNGFDPADFEQANAPAAASDFVVSYAGNMNAARNPLALWRALRQLDTASQMPRLRVRLTGNVDPVVVQSAGAEGVGEVIEQHPYVPHATAVRQMQRSALLLLVINRMDDPRGIIPGKVYEYVASGRPVLGIGPPEGDAARVLAAAGAGCMFDYDDVNGVADFLHEHYEAWGAGTPRQGAPPEAAAPYSRKTQAETLAQIMDRLAESDGRR